MSGNEPREKRNPNILQESMNNDYVIINCLGHTTSRQHRRSANVKRTQLSNFVFNKCQTDDREVVCSVQDKGPIIVYKFRDISEKLLTKVM